MTNLSPDQFPNRQGWLGGHAKAQPVYGRVQGEGGNWGAVSTFASLADAHHVHEQSFGPILARDTQGVTRTVGERPYPGDMHLYPMSAGHPDEGAQPTHVIKRASSGGYTMRYKVGSKAGVRAPSRRHGWAMDSR
ncbi:MAG TPA: hypothetical protein VFI41_05000 [Gemmatimonadales bacterium]|nr:hypothetical protein [Gemmatimonadales bacterium]